MLVKKKYILHLTYFYTVMQMTKYFCDALLSLAGCQTHSLTCP